jgi:hypothetical protein
MKKTLRNCKCCRAFEAKSSSAADVFALEELTVIDPSQSYIRAYPHIVSMLSTKTEFTQSDFVCASHMVYGWMPTILEIHANEHVSVAMGAELLTKAKKQGHLSHTELGQLAQLVNHSVIGASKLLHFVNPQAFAIWDSKVYRFVHGVAAHEYRVNNIAAYEHYLGMLGDMQRDTRITEFCISVKQKMGYSVSALRALEVVMFLNSAPSLKPAPAS